MGQVWKAHDTRLDRMVAIKMSGARFSDRFDREARAVAALNHPNICTLYDIGPDYLMMEYIDGAPVAPVESMRKLVDLAVQIADGLSAAHAAGILHRDLKPANILVTRAGRAKILDFGLAKSTAPAPDDATEGMTVTQPGLLLGTVAYMSPEQARGASLDTRSDQFSFGLVLYELAAGKRAFARPTGAETLAAIIREEPEALPQTVPAPLRWIIERLLAKDPEERYTSTKDLYHDLRGIRERFSEVPTGVTVPAAITRQKRRYLKPLLLLGAGLLAGILLTLMLLRPAEPDQSAYRFTPVSREEAAESWPVWSPDGKSIAYIVSDGGVRQLFTRTFGSPSPARLTRMPLNMPFWSPDGSAIYFVSGQDTWSIPASGGEPQVVLKNGRATTVHPDGTTFAFERNGKLWIGGAADGQAKEFSHPSFPSSQLVPLALRFSPDGSRLAVEAHSLAGEKLSTWILQQYPTGTARRIPYQGLAGREMNWFPDNRRLVMWQNDDAMSWLVIVDSESGRMRTIYKSPGWPRYPSVSPDGKRIAYETGASESDLIEIALPSGAVSNMLSRGGKSSEPAWAPSGTHYLFSTDIDGEAAIEDRTPQENVSRRLISISSEYFPVRPVGLHDPRWAPDGQRFTFASTGNSLKTWVAHTSGGRPVNIDPSAESEGASWSPDGLWIAYRRRIGGTVGKTQLVKIGTSAGATPTVLVDSPTSSTIQWSPTGDWILYGSRPGFALVSPDGKQRSNLTAKTLTVAGFSKTGDRVYGIFRNRDLDGLRWQLLSIDVKTEAETLLGTLNLPAATVGVSGFSLHPDGKRFATAINKSPSDIWMLEGFEQEKSWLDRLLRR